MIKAKPRVDQDLLDLRAMGISNWCYDRVAKKRYSVQFYDFDGLVKPQILKHIRKIFPYDCIMYETKHGTQFISFAVLKELRTTKARVIETSKVLGQDYWTEGKDLTLRVSAKWDTEYSEVSDKPRFKGLIRGANELRISIRHLEFYIKYMDLPQWVVKEYADATYMDLGIKIYHYKTRD